MKFAELTQDVQVQRGQEVHFDENVLQPGRRKQNLLYKRVSGQATEPLGDITNVNTRNSFGFNLPAVPPAFSMPPFPTWTVSFFASFPYLNREFLTLFFHIESRNVSFDPLIHQFDFSILRLKRCKLFSQALRRKGMFS